MTRKEIEFKIAFIMNKISETRDAADLATLNRCLEQLIMMDASDEAN